MASNNKNSLFWVSQSDTLNVAAPLVLAILAQLFFWLSQLLPAASVKLVNVSPETSNGRVLSPDCVTFLGGQFLSVFSSPPKKVQVLVLLTASAWIPPNAPVNVCRFLVCRGRSTVPAPCWSPRSHRSGTDEAITLATSNKAETSCTGVHIFACLL